MRAKEKTLTKQITIPTIRLPIKSQGSDDLHTNHRQSTVYLIRPVCVQDSWPDSALPITKKL